MNSRSAVSVAVHVLGKLQLVDWMARHTFIKGNVLLMTEIL